MQKWLSSKLQNNSNVHFMPKSAPPASKTLSMLSFLVPEKKRFTINHLNKRVILSYFGRSALLPVVAIHAVVSKGLFVRLKMHSKNMDRGCLIVCGVGNYKRWKKIMR